MACFRFGESPSPEIFVIWCTKICSKYLFIYLLIYLFIFIIYYIYLFIFIFIYYLFIFIYIKQSNIRNYDSSKAWISFQIVRADPSPFATIPVGSTNVYISVVFDITYKSPVKRSSAAGGSDAKWNSGASFVVKI